MGIIFFFTRKRPTRKQLDAALRVKDDIIFKLDAALRVKDDIIFKLYKELELRGRNVCPECGKKISCDRLKYWRDLTEYEKSYTSTKESKI